jgi:hypothetical protein
MVLMGGGSGGEISGCRVGQFKPMRGERTAKLSEDNRDQIGERGSLQC